MPNEISSVNSGPGQPSLLLLSTKGGARRWTEQRLSSYSSAKESFVLTVTLLVAFIGGPALIFFGMNWLLAGSLGTSGGGAAAIAFNNFLYALLLGLSAIALWLTIKIVKKPTHLSLTSEGLHYLYATPLGASRGPLVSWREITELKIIQPRNRTNPNEYQLSFLAGNKQLLSLQLGWLNTVAERQKLFEHVEDFLIDVPRSIDVALYLQPPSGHSYTEIWFQSLENAPNLSELIASADHNSMIFQNSATKEIAD